MSDLKKVDLKKLRPHARNANKGTERGAFQIAQSFKNYGAARSIVVDADGVIIAGNHAVDGALEAGIKHGVVVETEGDELVIVKRTDLRLASDKRAIELAYADNRSSQVGLEWDIDTLVADINEGVELGKFWRDDELKSMLQKEAEELEDAGKGGGGGEEEGGDTMVKLTMTAEQHAEFKRLSVALMQKWDLPDSTNVVLEAMRRAK